LGLPGVVLWGKTTEEIWRPPQERVVILKNPRGLKIIGVKQVMEKLNAVLRDNP